MNKLNELIDKAVTRYDTYLELDEIDEDLRNEIIFTAVDDLRLDKSEILIDGKFDLVELMRDVNDARISAEEMYYKILHSLKKSVENVTNELLMEAMDERIID